MPPSYNPTIERKNVLSHIAIIMDGNGRWAKKRFLPRFSGHKAGFNTVRKMVASCIKADVSYLTLFAFSSENWRRPKEEVKLLMGLFRRVLKHEIKKLYKENVKLNLIGDLSRFSTEIQDLIEESVDITKNNTGLVLTIAANYGGRWDIVQASKNMIKDVKEGFLDENEISETVLESYLQTSSLPEPDMLIRTGGEQRISNFLLWNLASSECYFTPTLWPDFDETELLTSIDWFKTRQRRFGRTGEQVETKKK